MNSHSCILNHLNLHFRLSPIHRRIHRLYPPSSSTSYLHCATIKLHPLVIQRYSSYVRRNASTRAFDEDSFDFPILDDWSPEESTSYVLSSSDGEDFDGDVFLTPVNDVDLPSSSASNKDALTVAA
ncbi:phospho-N-acetylmuramoyl-pentapeptide-transferase, partial [Trifolium pratense]